MNSVTQKCGKAGSRKSLPFLLLFIGWLLATGSRLPAAERALQFQAFESSCIDLGHYEAKQKKLTVRFVNRKPDQFYRYSNVPATVWKELLRLNEKGGVGNYLHETLLNDPKKYPYEVVNIKTMTTNQKSKKAGNSN